MNVAPGSSATRIGRKLEAAGVVRSRYAFDLVRWFRHGTLQAGMYRFDHPAPVTEVYARIARGDVFTKALTVPEGANIFDIAARVEQAGLGTRQDFLDAAASQTDLIADLDPGRKESGGLPVSGHLPVFTQRHGSRKWLPPWCSDSGRWPRSWD